MHKKNPNKSDPSLIVFYLCMEFDLSVWSAKCSLGHKTIN